MIEIKPRESYLKDKINKMEFNNNLLSGINKGIDEQLKSVKKDMIDKKVLLNESKKNLDKYVNKSFDMGKKINNINEDFNMKNKYKTIKELKIDKDILSRKLAQIIENENLIKNNNNSEFIYEQNLNVKIKRDMAIQKKKLVQKIENINEKIKELLLDEEKINNKKEYNLKNFIDNFERDKEIIEIRAKKYLKEKKERNKRIANDLNQLAEKRKKEIEDKNKKEKETQEKMKLQLKRKAKELEAKRSKEVGAKSLLYKPYINEKVEGSVKKYLFMQKYEKYLQEEQKLIDKENLHRKNKMKMITNEEMEEFNNKVDKRREEKKLITDKKTEKLLEEWSERKKTIPEYISPHSENAFNDIMKQMNLIKEKKDKAKEIIDKQKNYSEEIKYINPPKINKELEQKRLESINNLDPKRFFLDKDTLQHHKRKGRIILKRPDPTKPSKYTWKLKILKE